MRLNDTLTIHSLTDTVHAASGDVGGAANILPLVRVTTLTPGRRSERRDVCGREW